MIDMRPPPTLHATSEAPGNRSPETAMTITETEALATCVTSTTSEQRRASCGPPTAVVRRPVDHGRDQREDDGHGARILVPRRCEAMRGR